MVAVPKIETPIKTERKGGAKEGGDERARGNRRRVSVKWNAAGHSMTGSRPSCQVT